MILFRLSSWSLEESEVYTFVPLPLGSSVRFATSSLHRYDSSQSLLGFATPSSAGRGLWHCGSPKRYLTDSRVRPQFDLLFSRPVDSSRPWFT